MGKSNYCKVNVGDVFNNKYKAVKQLGRGRFSNCWEVEFCSTVELDEPNKSFALKIQKNKKEYSEVAEDEIKIFQEMTGECPNVIRLIDHFRHQNHICMVLDKMDVNLLDLLEKKHNNGMPVPLVKEISRQVLQGLKFLKDNEIIHADLKLENILLKVEDSRINVKIGDFGSSCWTHKHFTDNIGTTEYRSLESIINADYDCAVDIWATACIVFELLTNSYLFDPHSYVDEIEVNGSDDSSSDSSSSDSGSDSSSSDDEDEYLVDQMHLWLIASTLGDIPVYIQRRGELSNEYFHRAGNMRKKPSFIKNISISKKLVKEYNFSEKEADEIEEFLLPMLEFDAEKRATAEEMLKHSWLNT
jgi:serine/threonine protein kinase